jgi:hypothetical protein
MFTPAHFQDLGSHATVRLALKANSRSGVIRLSGILHETPDCSATGILSF